MAIASAQSPIILRAGSPADAGMDAARVTRIGALGKDWIREGITPTLVLLAARHGTIFLHESFGTLVSSSAMAPPNTIFSLASLSKPFTATAIMMLVEEGRIGLGRAVQDYIPEFSGKGKEDVLIWHLLTHTSGLRWEDVDFYASTTGMMAPVPEPEATEHQARSEYLHRRYAAPLWKAPGEQMSYNNMNYSLLGEIVRRVSGQAFATFLQQRIFAPLGMDDSHTSFPTADEARVATVPAGAETAGGFPTAITRYWPASGPGGCYSTALDVARFGQMFLSRGRYSGVRLLSPAAVTQMSHNQIPGISVNLFGQFHREASWGFGLQIAGDEKWSYFDGSIRPSGTFGHGGGSGGFLWIDPDNDLVGVYLSVASALDQGVFRHRFDMYQNAVYAALDV
jgi:CubicO group peptidase (beta-lactamase class C family)